MTDVKDWLGQEIHKGALVMYSTSYGSSSVESRLGRVVKLDKDKYGGVALVEWLKTNKYSLPDARATKVGTDKLTVMPDDFFEHTIATPELEGTPNE